MKFASYEKKACSSMLIRTPEDVYCVCVVGEGVRAKDRGQCEGVGSLLLTCES